MRKDLLYILLLGILIGIGFYRIKNQKIHVEDKRFKIDTIVTIEFETKNPEATTVLDSAFAIFDHYEKIVSYYKPGSVLDSLNKNEKEIVKLHPVLEEIILNANDFYKLSNEKYDITIGSLTDLWDFDKQTIPTIQHIEEAKKNIGFEKIKIENGKLYRPKKMKINLGSIAKGYIIDKTIDYLKSQHIERGIINAGGDIRIFGDFKKKFRIGIQHPRQKGELFDVIELSSGAVVTSGDYERFFMKEDRRYHHIIDPDTGFPTKNAISVSITAPTAMEADAISTACFLMQPADAIAMLENLPNVEGLVISKEEKNLKTYKTKNFKHKEKK